MNYKQLLNEAQHDIKKLLEANHLIDLQIEGYCNRIKELMARDAVLEDDLAFIIGATELGSEVREKAEHAWNVLKGGF